MCVHIAEPEIKPPSDVDIEILKEVEKRTTKKQMVELCTNRH
jgi:hypothetical protein